ncbi:MAG: histidinol-phosphatase HisJ family protein [Clostridiales bacterium]
MRICSDVHMHSVDFSGDAVSTMEEMCQSSINQGLERICFTEHVDFDPHYDDSIPFDPVKYDNFIDTMRSKFGDKIKILQGVEVGEPHMYPEEYDKILKRNYDMVMVGLHYVNLPMGLHWTGNGGKDIFTFAVDRIYRRYYEDLLAVVKLGGFDVLAHFDYPKRYLKKDAQEDDLINEILTLLVKSPGLLEINTSSWRYGFSESTPGNKILKKYKDIGGSKVTIGSDAHDKKDVGFGVERGFNLAEEIGLEVGYFENRKYCKL